jgi:short-subunit dehydrogenase
MLQVLLASLALKAQLLTMRRTRFVPKCTHNRDSKFAVVGMTDAMRRELADWGVHVSMVLPGIMVTMCSSVRTAVTLYGEEYAVVGGAT